MSTVPNSANTRVALLIDCDNVSSQAISGVLQELAKLGAVNIRHAHGDWKSPHLVSWIEKLQPHAIRPVQQFAYTTGKNATDCAMIIDAMDLLYSGNVDAFALMTSDSDFTPLVMRILESGKPVYGFGERKTPTAFVNACSQFIYIENLMQPAQNKARDSSSDEARERTIRNDIELRKMLCTAVEATSEIDGWSNLAKVGHYISNTSSFSPINHGYKKLSDLLRASGLFAIKTGADKAMYVRTQA